jgi:hypothetical protein
MCGPEQTNFINPCTGAVQQKYNASYTCNLNFSSSHILNGKKNSQVWCHESLIPALRRQNEKDHKFKASLGYKERLCLKKKK